MTEIELKFQIPQASLAAVSEAVGAHRPHHGAPVGHTLMQALYFDTADHALARRRCALRIRRENGDWVQTFKGAGADAMTRLEENRSLAPPTGPAVPNLGCHSDAVQRALADTLPGWSPASDPRGHQSGLGVLYETRFERQHGQLDAHGSQVLLCLDQGHIAAGPATHPLAELEMELAHGSALDLIDAARPWVTAHGLWLDVQSKAMKGTRLAAGSALSTQEPVRAQAVHGPVGWAHDLASATSPERVRAGLSAALDACAGNWAELAQGKSEGTACRDAWAEALVSLLQAQGANPAVRGALPEAFWDETRHQHDRLAAAPDATAWGHLARQSHTTLWALDLLAALQASRA